MEITVTVLTYLIKIFDRIGAAFFHIRQKFREHEEFNASKNIAINNQLTAEYVDFQGFIKKDKRFKVLSGIFEGMIFHEECVRHSIIPMQLGIYESSLYPFLLQIAGGVNTTFIDIGAADGYFAVGMLYIGCKKTIAFDISVEMQMRVKKLAAINNLDSKCTTKGVCTSEELDNLLKNITNQDEKICVLLDIEGFECELLNKSHLMNKNVSFVIETHPDDVTSSFVKSRFYDLLLTSGRDFQCVFEESNEIRLNKVRGLLLDDGAETVAMKNRRNPNQSWIILP